MLARYISSHVRRLLRELAIVREDRDFWKRRAQGLEMKLEKRSDLFVEREMALVDRFLTSQAKTFAITDEVKERIRRDENPIDRSAVEAAQLEAFLDDKYRLLVEFATEAGIENPTERAQEDFEKNKGTYILEFESRLT